MASLSEHHSDVELGSPRGVSAGEEVVPSAAPASPAPGGSLSASATGAPVAEPSTLVQGLSEATGSISSALPGDALSASISKLKKKQAELRNQKKELAKDLRNAERRKKRLRTHARQLTDEDLVQVLMLRKQQRADRNALEVASTASGASSSAVGGVSSGGSSSSRARSSSDP